VLDDPAAKRYVSGVAFRNADDGGKILLVVNGAPEARTFGVRHAGRRLRYSRPAGAVATFTWP